MLDFLLTPGQHHEAVIFLPLMEQRVVKRQGWGPPQEAPEPLVGR